MRRSGEVTSGRGCLAGRPSGAREGREPSQIEIFQNINIIFVTTLPLGEYAKHIKSASYRWLIMIDREQRRPSPPDLICNYTRWQQQNVTVRNLFFIRFNLQLH